jgi:hypothetical protein
MRRRKLLAALVGLAVLVAVGVVVLWPRLQRDRIIRANSECFHYISRALVEAILGPAADFGL